MLPLILACAIEATGPSGKDTCTAPTDWYADADL